MKTPTKILGILSILLLAFSTMTAQNTKTYDHRFDPPWDDVPQEGTQFIPYGIDNAPDFHGDINNPDLVIFFAGNQYMVVPELLEAFRKEYPQYKRVFAETIPPGIENRQVESGALVLGSMRITLKPDIVTAGKGKIDKQKEAGTLTETLDYAKNKLAIMVYKGNPTGIKTLKDLGNPEVRVSNPNPEWEGIAAHINDAYVNAGGDDLKKLVMTDKVAKNSTFLTTIHHRQTPMRIMYGQSDAGPVWYSEAYYHAKMTNHPIEMVTIADDVNVEVTYSAGIRKEAPRPEAAKAFMKFLNSTTAHDLYKKYGFTMP